MIEASFEKSFGKSLLRVTVEACCSCHRFQFPSLWKTLCGHVIVFMILALECSGLVIIMGGGRVVFIELDALKFSGCG